MLLDLTGGSPWVVVAVFVAVVWLLVRHSGGHDTDGKGKK